MRDPKGAGEVVEGTARAGDGGPERVSGLFYESQI